MQILPRGHGRLMASGIRLTNSFSSTALPKERVYGTKPEQTHTVAVFLLLVKSLRSLQVFHSRTQARLHILLHRLSLQDPGLHSKMLLVLHGLSPV